MANSVPTNLCRMILTPWADLRCIVKKFIHSLIDSVKHRLRFARVHPRADLPRMGFDE
jgi:hypothetical protein